LWGYVRGGMGSISKALAASAEAHGARILLDAEVGQILTKDGRAKGVALANGDTYTADTILSNADAVRTFGLLDTAPPPQIAVALKNWKTNGVSCKINMAVSELPDFRVMPGTEPGPQHLGTVHLAPTMEFLEAAWSDARQGIPSRNPMVEVYIQSGTDRSLAPPGKHILSCFTQYFPYELADGLDYEAEKQRYADRVVEIIAQHAPNVPASIEARQVLTPRDIEERFGITGGHIFHGEITPDQMFGGRLGMRGPQTPVPGLTFCGSAAYPGGCVSGIPGWNAARAVLDGPHPPAPSP
jgi:phytoene dehydrogenase-like protein